MTLLGELSIFSVHFTDAAGADARRRHHCQRLAAFAFEATCIDCPGQRPVGRFVQALGRGKQLAPGKNADNDRSAARQGGGGKADFHSGTPEGIREDIGRLVFIVGENSVLLRWRNVTSIPANMKI